MDDDFEIEVTDLRTGQVLKSAHDLPAPAALPPVPALPRDAGTGDFELEVQVSDLPTAPTPGEMPTTAHGILPPRQRPTRRQLIGASASAALVVVVLIGLLGGVVGKGGFTFGLFPTPMPTATLAEGADTFYMVNAVPWGQLRADGKLVSVTYIQGNPTFFTLAIGRHAIEYVAPPFSAVRCTVSVPAVQSDTCPLYSGSSSDSSQGVQISGQNQSIQPNNRGIDFGDTLTRLPPNQYQALANAVTASIAAPLGTTTVPAGDRYQGANGQVLVAAQPLQAQVFYTLNPESSPGMFGQSCTGLCDIPFGNGQPLPSGWSILANITAVWRYTESSGTTVQLPAMPVQQGLPTFQPGPPGMAMFVSVNWTGTWQISSSMTVGGDAGCFDAFEFVTAAPSFGNWVSVSSGSFNQSERAAPNPADGCLMVFQASDGQGNLTGKPLWFLYRFGFVYTANAAAHQVIPELPVASGREATLARQLAALLTQQNG